VKILSSDRRRQTPLISAVVTNSDADWSFGNGRAQFLTGELESIDFRRAQQQAPGNPVADAAPRQLPVSQA
jgi:hypothetical protein